ncbi:unnamed protein product [Closterium sp. Yama58-4]|nr:unnamed protein product [Closterium sp. Yama58-4]
MPRLYRRAQLAVHIKKAICAHHVQNPLMRHVDLARWCFTRYGLRPDRSTIGRILKAADRWRAPSADSNPVRVRGGAQPDLESAMVRWISNAGPAGIPLTLQTIRDHVADMAVVRTCKEKLPQLLLYLCVSPRDVYNFDETALFLSMLPRKTYGRTRVAGRKIPKERLTVGLLVNADGSHAFRPLVISKSRRPHDFRPDFDPEPLCYWRHNKKGWMTALLFTLFMEQLNAAMVAEERHIVILLDNASSHVLKTEDAETEDLFGFRTRSLSNLRLVFLPPNTTAFTQPLDQGLIAMTKARYRQHWLEAVVERWVEGGATVNFLRDVLAWLLDAWMNIGPRTIQRCWWRTECLPLAWALSLSHVGTAGLTPGGRDVAPLDIDLDEEIGDVGILIDRLALGPSAMPAADFVAIDAGQPTCAEPGEDPLAEEPATAYSAASWEPPASMEAVYQDADPASREARRYARAASEMLIGYARSTCITPRELCALFEIRNPIIVARMERASPPLNLNATPIATPRLSETPDAVRPRPRGRVLPAWMTAPSPRQALIDAGAPAVMDGFMDAAEWVRL